VSHFKNHAHNKKRHDPKIKYYQDQYLLSTKKQQR